MRRERIFYAFHRESGNVADSRSRCAATESIAGLWYWMKTMVMEMMMDDGPFVSLDRSFPGTFTFVPGNE